MIGQAPEKLSAGAAHLTKLAKVETVALWHAVNWMENVLREWKREGFKDDQDLAQHEVQRHILTTARRALRKVNKIRKEQRT